MAFKHRDGYVDLELNVERTQAFATIYPPFGDGKSVSAKQVIENLQRMGVMYGYRETDIMSAIHQADMTREPVVKALVAQGVLPEEGCDARILWKIDEALVGQPIPRLPNGRPDYFAFEVTRQVKAGQLICSVIPARPGTPGKTVTAPLKSVAQVAGRPASIMAGANVLVSSDQLQFTAAMDGLVEICNDKISVHALRIVEGGLGPGNYEYASGVIIKGDMSGAALRAQGIIAVQGNISGCAVRTETEMIVVNAANAELAAAADIYVLGSLRDCVVNTPKRLIMLPNTRLVGGEATATEGMTLFNAGAEDFRETRVVVGINRFSEQRLAEVQQDIAGLELNLQKIAQALKPLSTISADNVTPQRKQLMQTLLEQRRTIEGRIRELHNQKRLLTMSAKARTNAVVEVQGTVQPGVWINVADAAVLVEAPVSRASFTADSSGRSVVAHPVKPAA